MNYFDNQPRSWIVATQFSPEDDEELDFILNHLQYAQTTTEDQIHVTDDGIEVIGPLTLEEAQREVQCKHVSLRLLEDEHDMLTPFITLLLPADLNWSQLGTIFDQYVDYVTDGVDDQVLH